MRVVSFALMLACIVLVPLAAAGPIPLLVQQLAVPGTGSLGDAIDVDGDWMVVGAPSDAENGWRSGAVHVYLRTTTGWTLQSRIPSWASDASGRFGDAVALSGDWLAVGAPLESHSSGQGWVYLYHKQGTDWVPSQFLQGSGFGRAIALSGDMLFIGEPGNDDRATSSGAVHVYRSVGSLWNHHATLYPSTPSGHQRFGYNLDIDGDRLAVSAVGASEAYVFERTGTTWAETAIVRAGGAGMFYGFGTALHGDTLVLSTSNGQWDGVLGKTWGMARVYAFDGTSWNLQQDLHALQPESPGFGLTARLLGNTLVVGAPGEDLGARDSGRAYLFVRAGGVWMQEAALDPPRNGEGQGFGRGLALTGTDVLVGAPGDDMAGSDAGSVLVYRHPST